MSSLSISAIIPFLNEEKKIAHVVQQLLKNPLIDEVICINDGSTDKSVQKLKKYTQRIHLIDLKTNHGKGYALAKGIEKAKGEIVVFFDADLTNLTQEHIDSLLEPIVVKKARAVLGYSTGGYFAFWFKSVTGERAYYRKDVLPHTNALRLTNRFSTEYYLNSLFHKDEVVRVPLHKLVHLLKHEKYTFRSTIKETLKDMKTISYHAWGKFITQETQ